MSTSLEWPANLGDLLARCSFPTEGAAVTCAVSGGPDSMAMLALAVAAACRPHAVYIDHGLRPGGKEEAALVKAGADAARGVLRSHLGNRRPGPDLEARARYARYAVLPEGCMVGHTADDQAETLLLNLLRGAGLDGLSGMQAAGRCPAGFSARYWLCGAGKRDPSWPRSGSSPSTTRPTWRPASGVTGSVTR